MTDYTPTQARELADQVEALTTENAAILRASLHSADLATQALADMRVLTAERDALLARIDSIAQAKPMFWVRLLKNGLYEGPVHHNSADGRLLRQENPNDWVPLYVPKNDVNDAVEMVSVAQPVQPVQPTKWKETAYGLYLLEAGNGEVLESIKTSNYDGTATIASSKKQYTSLAAAKSAAQAIAQPVADLRPDPKAVPVQQPAWPSAQPVYLEGVNTDRLSQALTWMGVAGPVSKESYVSDMALYVNVLAAAVMAHKRATKTSSIAQPVQPVQPVQPESKPCFMCHGQGWHYIAHAYPPGVTVPKVKIACTQCVAQLVQPPQQSAQPVICSVANFAKIFTVEGYGQVLAKIGRSKDGAPELRWFAKPPEFGVCSISLEFADDDDGWDFAESSLQAADQIAATAAVAAIWGATGTSKETK